MLVAEMLVHEACHQYFYLVRRLGPVHDLADTQLYYSPAVDRERRLDRIVMAYHAFANVLCFYRTAMGSGMEDEVCARVESELQDDVVLMERTLVGNPALTALGAALVEPLAQCYRK